MVTNDAGQQVLQGAGNFPYTATIDGDDLTVGDENITTGVDGAHIVATNFGGTAQQDPYDNGQTASGISTRLHPDLEGCSLAMSGEHCSSTEGSPLPRMPYKDTMVHVWCEETGIGLTLPLIDLGPALNATTRPDQIHAIDLTRAAFVALGGNLRAGLMRVRYRILGGVQYIGH